jgi:hypothetical protein
MPSLKSLKIFTGNTNPNLVKMQTKKLRLQSVGPEYPPAFIPENASPRN